MPAHGNSRSPARGKGARTSGARDVMAQDEAESGLPRRV